jgi:hypothetical protein
MLVLQRKTRRALPYATGLRIGRLLTFIQGRPELRMRDEG